MQIKCLAHEHSILTQPGFEPSSRVSTEAMRIKCLAHEHSILTQPGLEPSIGFHFDISMEADYENENA